MTLKKVSVAPNKPCLPVFMSSELPSHTNPHLCDFLNQWGISKCVWCKQRHSQQRGACPLECSLLNARANKKVSYHWKEHWGGLEGWGVRDELPAHAILPPQLMHQTYKWCPLGLPAPVKPPDDDRNMNDLWRNQQKNCQWPSPNCTTVSK